MFQETNTDFKQREALEQFQSHMLLHYPTNFTIASNSSIKGKSSLWLPGGTMIGVMDRWTGSKITAGTDPVYGRWSWVSLQGQQGRIITMVSVYRVNPGNNSSGEFSAYKQQYNLILKHEDSFQDPRKKTIEDLQMFLTQRINQKEEIVLSIDANEICHQDHSLRPHTIANLFHTLGLENLTQTLPPGDTHKRGRCIDFCAITPNLKSAVKAFGYLPYDRITTTDHRMYFLDLQIKEIFLHKHPTLPTPLLDSFDLIYLNERKST